MSIGGFHFLCHKFAPWHACINACQFDRAISAKAMHESPAKAHAHTQNAIKLISAHGCSSSSSQTMQWCWRWFRVHHHIRVDRAAAVFSVVLLCFYFSVIERKLIFVAFLSSLIMIKCQVSSCIRFHHGAHIFVELTESDTQRWFRWLHEVHITRHIRNMQ